MSERAQGDQEPTPRDVTQEFETMNSIAFSQFLETLQNEPSLAIITNWTDAWRARALKSFLEDPKRGKQKRSAMLRATEKQHAQEINVFASGVKWIEVK